MDTDVEAEKNRLISYRCPVQPGEKSDYTANVAS